MSLTCRSQWENDELQKIKSDYEYKITVMSKRITDLERENEDSRDALHVRALISLDLNSTDSVLE